MHHVECIVVALGTIPREDRELISYHIPYFNYDTKLGHIVSTSWLLSALYEVPLLFYSFALIFKRRPQAIIANGLLPAIILSYLTAPLHIKVVCSWHGIINPHYGPVRIWFLRKVTALVDHVFVNSQISRENLLAVMNSDKVTIVEHWADPVFFRRIERETVRQKYGLGSKFVVLFVGRIDHEKLFQYFLDLARRMVHNSDYVFIVAGVGEYNKILHDYPNIRYMGYVADRERLKELYTIADIVWTYADETYVARPGIEALACGTPIILPNVVAATVKHNTRVRGDVIPPEVGWIVDIRDMPGIERLVREIKERGLATERRRACVNYAIHRHSIENLLAQVRTLREIVKW